MKSSGRPWAATAYSPSRSSPKYTTTISPPVAWEASAQSVRRTRFGSSDSPRAWPARARAAWRVACSSRSRESQNRCRAWAALSVTASSRADSEGSKALVGAAHPDQHAVAVLASEGEGQRARLQASQSLAHARADAVAGEAAHAQRVTNYPLALAVGQAHAGDQRCR